ncbi:MAG: adenine-specific DNA-methyltransferase [Fimbriimonadaceae bacterium]|nr:adenine-specific DNA-methyltransferase [Fimbriimonadaceae bacterium]
MDLATPRLEAICTDVYGHGEELGRLFRGDSQEALYWLLQEGHRGTVDLAYIDPPFGSGSNYARKIQLRGVDGDLSITVPAYQDLWSDGAYLQFMLDRLVLLRELLSPTGSLYLHVDTAQAHYLKVICDEVFGRENFQREIVWRIGWVSGYKSQAKNWIRNHDTILFYSKDPDNFHFEKQYAPYADGYKRRGEGATKGKGHPIEDTWNCSEQDRLDSIQIKSFSAEKTGYPTQKNEQLIERIIRSSCPEGGRVLDCFVGSGTTAAVAQKLSRRWLAVDANPAAIHTTRTRLLENGLGQLSSGFSIYDLEPANRPLAVHRTPRATVGFKRKGNALAVSIEDFQSPALLSEVIRQCGKREVDWRSTVDCVLLDLHHDSTAFRMDFSDLPARRELVVRGNYRPRTSGRVAVKIIDLLGNEALVLEP